MRVNATESIRCYGCGLTIADPQAAVSVDLASSSGRSFAEPVSMHERCARAYVPVECRARCSPISVATRRRLARELRAGGHTFRGIARALGVSARTIRLDLAQ